MVKPECQQQAKEKTEALNSTMVLFLISNLLKIRTCRWAIICVAEKQDCARKKGNQIPQCFPIPNILLRSISVSSAVHSIFKESIFAKFFVDFSYTIAHKFYIYVSSTHCVRSHPYYETHTHTGARADIKQIRTNRLSSHLHNSAPACHA